MSDIMGAIPATPNLPAYQPAQVTQGPSSIEEMLNTLGQQRKALEQQQSQAIQQATIPIIQSAKLTPNLGSVPNHEMAPLNHTPTVGGGNARAQGIGNVAIAAMNILGQYENKKTEQKQRVLSQDIEKYYGAIDGEQQAKQVLAQDPNNAEAKAALAKNSQIQNDILSDDKRRKQIAKALNLNFTDPSKNTAMEHKAGEQAAKSYAEQAKAQLPTQTVQNQAAIQKAQLTHQQLEGVDKAIAETTKLATSQMAEQGRVAIALMKEQGANDRTSATIAQRAATAKMQSEAATDRALKVAKMNNNTRMAVEVSREKAAYQRMSDGIEKRFDLANGITAGVDPKTPKGIAAKAKQDAVLQNTYKMLEKSKTDATTQIGNLETLRDKADPSTKEMYDTQIQQYETHLQYYQANQDKIEQQLGLQVASDGNVKSNSTNNAGEEQNTVVSPSDTEDNNPGDDENTDPDAIN